MKKRRRKLDRLFDPARYEDEMRIQAEKLAAFEARMIEARRRAEDRLAQQLAAFEARSEQARARAELLRTAMDKRFPRKKPRKGEGGEPVPVIPNPKPKPLAGGAAAPIEKERPRRTGVNVRPRPGRVRSDVDSRQIL